MSVHDISGLQLIDVKSFQSLAAVYSKVLYVPKYLIVNREGKIINSDAPQPIEPELRLELNRILNSKL